MPPQASRRSTIRLAIGLLALSALACNAFDGSTEPGLALPLPPTAAAESAVGPGEPSCIGCEIAATATIEADEDLGSRSGSSGEATIVMHVDLNIRSGPGIHYDRVSFILKDEKSTILGKDVESGWWRIECPPRIVTRECWVSGGTQYATAFNVEGVPTAVVPATSTPSPPTPDAAAAVPSVTTGSIVYGGDSGLWALSLDMSRNPPAAGVPWLLSEQNDLSSVKTSPDGEKIAYLSQTLDSNTLHIMNIDENFDRAMVSSAELPVKTEANATVLIAQIQWMANSQGVAFNTSFSSFLGSEIGARQDLWTLMIDGTIIESVSAGKGGGFFTLSSADQVIVSQAEEIARMNLDGSGRETILQFDPVDTGSEYVYFARPQWVNGGHFALVAIPSAKGFSPAGSAQLWQIGISGDAEPLHSLPGNTLFNSIRWTVDGERLAYVQQSVNGENTPRTLAVASGDGQGLTAYATGEIGPFVEWSPDGKQFLYTEDGFVVVGKPGTSAIETRIPAGTVAAQWLTSNVFVVPQIVEGKWRFEISNLSGQRTTFVTGNREYVEYDLWTR